MKNTGRVRLRTVSAVLSVLCLTTCSKHGTQSPQPGAGADLPTGFHALAPGRLQLIRGADQAGIRAYLQSVREVQPKKFEVQWSPETVAISRDEALRSLHAINDDGSEYTFASSEPVVRKLKKGAILWVYDITIAKVVDTGIIGDETIVYTQPVALTEALTKADIEFSAQPDYASAYGGYQTHSRPDTRQGAHVRHDSLFRRVALEQGEPPAQQTQSPTGPAEKSAPGEQQPESDDLIYATAQGYAGTVGSFRYSMNFASSPDQMILDFEATKAEGDATSHEIHREQQDEFFELVKEEYAAQHEADQYKKLMAEYGKELVNPGPEVPPTGLGPSGGGAAAGLADYSGTYGSPTPARASTAGNPYDLLSKEQKEVTEKYHAALEQEEQIRTREKALQSAGALAAHVFFIAADNFDVRFRSKLTLNRMSVLNALKIDNSQLQMARIDFSNLSGRVDLEFVGRLGEGGQGTVSMPVADIPVLFYVPVPVDGIPFQVEFGADFLLKIFLSGNHATHHWVSHYTFGGDEGITAGPAQTEGSGHVDTGEPVVEEKTAMSPGASGLVFAVQLPKIGLGLGLFGGGAMGFADIVNVITVTNAPAVAVLNPPCKRFTQQRQCHVGVELTLLPTVPFVGAVVSHMLSYTHSLHLPNEKKGSKTAVCDPPLREWVEPDIPMCHI